MADELDVGFDDLVTYRQQLHKFCSLHYGSLFRFRSGISFKLYDGETLKGKGVHNLTSSATCIASLLGCPDVLRPQSRVNGINGIAREFSIAGLNRSHKRWWSEKSAHIYCRCRALPLIVKHVPTYNDVIREHVRRILWQVETNPKRSAIGEAAEEYGKDPSKWYPENAFHTYWTLYLLDGLENRFPDEFSNIRTELSGTSIDIDRLRTLLLAWARQTAGYQTALHAAGSPTLDSDQLAWSLAIITRFGEDFQADLPKQDFLRYALKCLFEQQNASGIWRRGAALFHYPKSGNAYCYVFETFAVLLQSALIRRPESLFLRKVLSPYVGRLIRLWRYATLTQIPLADTKWLGWSSGHRVIHKQPESWATASVFSYAQSLRRLLGIWAREAAGSQLHISTTHSSGTEAIEKLRDRGATWSSVDKSTATKLITSFVNPITSNGSQDRLEPDSLLIQDEQARGAILFGPPGTSKTTLCQAVADAIDWDYVELHASHFVAEGLSNVQLTANKIFDQLMQLDRTVILFDEIDEMVRARDVEPDAFGRFLTTSMLPKLGKLWKRRKVIYFIATNDIRFFDPAVTRAERFDLVIQVPPPSFNRKVSRVLQLLNSISNGWTTIGFTQNDVEQALRSAAGADKGDPKNPTPLPTEYILAKFLLLRYDQLHELAALIPALQRGKSNGTVPRKLMEDALSQVADPFLCTCGPYKHFVESANYERHDFSKTALWEVEGVSPASMKHRIVERNGKQWYHWDPAFDDMGKLGGKCTVTWPGVIRCPSISKRSPRPLAKSSGRKPTKGRKK